MATSIEPNPSVTAEAVRGDASPRFHSGKSFFWGVALILVVGFVAWLLIGYFGTDNFETLDQKRVKEREAILQKRNMEDWQLLNEPPSYMDKAKGKIRVPLQEAMTMALVSLQANKPHAAYPLSQSPPQPAAAPTSPDKGAGSPKNGNINPPDSNPTVGQAAPATAQSPTPAPPTTAGTSAPNAPAASATPQVGTAAMGTPPAQTPAATNNALNPGPAASGVQPQPSPQAPGNTETTGGPTPSGVQPPPAASANASPQNPPAPSPKEPGVSPGGTP